MDTGPKDVAGNEAGAARARSVAARWPSPVPPQAVLQPPVVLGDGHAWDRASFQQYGLRGLHCGCGPRLRGGWLNTDLADIRTPAGQPIPLDRVVRLGGSLFYFRHDAGTPFPFADGSFEWVYSEHFVEHVPRGRAVAWLREVRRLLAPGGVARVTTPDLRKYVEGYLDPEGAFFKEHARRLRHIGVPHVPDRRAWMVNQIFFAWGHRWLYDWEELCAAAADAGFAPAQLRRAAFRTGAVPEVAALDLEHRSDETLYVEMFPDAHAS